MPIRMAIASGKGGTGKTTVATNLAAVMADQGYSVQLLDCDVEEPNCHIFLNPQGLQKQGVTVPTPRLIPEKCAGCGKCAEVCQFSAITCVQQKVLLFPELCHNCGGCSRFCPAGALVEQPREVGQVEQGVVDGIHFGQGRLHVGEVATPAVIKAVKQQIQSAADFVLIDAPPGTTCPVISAVQDCDFVLLVTEPTPFGLHDLRLAVEMTRTLDIPMGVVINRSDSGSDEVLRYCLEEGIAVLQQIPDDRGVAELYSRGMMASQSLKPAMEWFRTLLDAIRTHLDPAAKREGA